MGNQLELRSLAPLETRPVVTQEEAVLALLAKLQRELKEAEQAVFDVVHREARDRCSSNLAIDMGTARGHMMAANRAMANIDELGVCFPGDEVRRVNWRWVPAKGATQ